MSIIINETKKKFWDQKIALKKLIKFTCFIDFFTAESYKIV